MYHQQVQKLAYIKKSYQWPEKAGLKDTTEAQMMAAQEQALSTKSTETRIYHSRQDPRCRLYKDAPEIVQHTIAKCMTQAGTAYTE